MNRLIVIDMQNDFVSDNMRENGLVDKVVSRIIKAENDNECLYLTMDKHDPESYGQTEESKFYPLHCVENTKGSFLCPEVGEAIALYRKRTIVEKHTFACPELVRYLEMDLREDDTLELIGVCTDICVLSNALMLREKFPNTPIMVNLSCCAATTKEAGEATKIVLKSNAITAIGDSL